MLNLTKATVETPGNPLDRMTNQELDRYQGMLQRATSQRAKELLEALTIYRQNRDGLKPSTN